MNWHEVIKDAFFGLVALNVAVTLAVAVNPGLLVQQKIGQTLLVWLIPILGGLFIGIFMWTQRGSATPTGYNDSSERGPRDVYLGSHRPGP